jgi:hypothetical protein
MLPFRELPGLPPCGPPAQNFSDIGYGKHSEGFVVEFFPDEDRSWIGNFHRGLSECDDVLPHFDGRHLIVVSGGSAYVVDPKSKVVVENFGAQIEFCAAVADLGVLIFGNGLWFEFIFSNGKSSRTKRISWDGMRNVLLQGGGLLGDAYDPMQDTWIAFEVDIVEGAVTGGSYII